MFEEAVVSSVPAIPARLARRTAYATPFMAVAVVALWVLLSESTVTVASGAPTWNGLGYSPNSTARDDSFMQNTYNGPAPWEDHYNYWGSASSGQLNDCRGLLMSTPLISMNP